MDPVTKAQVKAVRLSAAGIGWLLVVVIAICGALYMWGMKRKVERLEEQAVTATSDKAADDSWRGGYILMTQDKEKSNAATSKALDAHPDYRDQPVPDDIADGLRDPASTRR